MSTSVTNIEDNHGTVHLDNGDINTSKDAYESSSSSERDGIKTSIHPPAKKRIRKKRECPWIIYQIEQLPRSKIKLVNNSNIIPPNVKRDTRLDLAFMWANTLNSYDSNQLINFLYTFSVPNCVHIQRHIDNNLNELGLVFRAKGFFEIALTTAIKLCMYPDISVVPSCVTVSSSGRGSKVKGEGRFTGTRVFEGPNPNALAAILNNPHLNTPVSNDEENSADLTNSLLAKLKYFDMFRLQGRRLPQPCSVIIISKMTMYLDECNRINKLEYYDINADITYSTTATVTAGL